MPIATTAQYESPLNGFYTFNTYPSLTITGHQLNTLNMYDNYNYDLHGFTIPSTVLGQTVSQNVKGLLTASSVRALVSGVEKWEYVLNLYDDKGRNIFVGTLNEYLSVTNIMEIELDFMGQLKKVKTTHTKGVNAPIITEEVFTYDHMRRLVSQTNKVDNKVSKRLVHNNYDALGQLESKILDNGTEDGYKDLVGVTVSNDEITKTAAAGWNNVGLVTKGSFSNDGYIEYIIPQIDKDVIIGVSSTNLSSRVSYDIDYSIFTASSRKVSVWESQTKKANHSELYEAGDIFRIERVGTTINYSKNGKVFYTSLISSSGVLFGDVAIDDNQGKVKDLKIISNTDGIQNIDYTYNVRGWLKQINNPNSLGNDLFGFKINYNTADHNATKLYNGNIAETEWKTQNDNILRHYVYSYDALNRITVGGYNNAASTEPGWFNVTNISYDKNGNLLSLNRAKKGTPTAGAASDYLTYFYDAGNKLLKVEEQYDGAGSFEDGTNSGDDYDYDLNGNTILDHNKGIGTTVADQITYNHLNLPTYLGINKGSDIGNISYIYDATGVKLKKVVSTGATTEYAGNYVYENSSLKFFNHAEGYAEPDGSGGYDYVYQYKDHLGNVRLSYKDANESYQNVFDDNFTNNTGDWVTKDGSTFVLENGRLKVNVDGSWEGVTHNLGNINVSPGDTFKVKLTFDKGNTQSTVRVLIKEMDANGVYLSYVGLNWNQLSGSYEYDYTVNAANKIQLFIHKINTNTSTETQFYIDHISMTRGSLEILEENNYYPFGLKHKGYNNVINGIDHKYGFGGKEEQDELGLNMLDFHARSYDPAIGRWTSIDPVTHYSMSTYNAFNNSPIYWADPSGTTSVSSIQGAWDATPEGGSSSWNSDGNGGFCDDCPKEGETKEETVNFGTSYLPNRQKVTKYYHTGVFNSSEAGWYTENRYYELYRTAIRALAQGYGSMEWFNNTDFTEEVLGGISSWIIQATEYYSAHYDSSKIGNATPMYFDSPFFLPGAALKYFSSGSRASSLVFKWANYPAGGIKPSGPFRLLAGTEYAQARKLANKTNAALRRANPTKYKGYQIHEIHPVKFGGSPTNLSNKILLTPKQHAQYTNFWNALMRKLNN